MLNMSFKQCFFSCHPPAMCLVMQLPCLSHSAPGARIKPSGKLENMSSVS